MHDADDPHHRHALKARAAKRDAAHGTGVDDAYVASFVDRFYGTIREDELLGPIFNERIEDWPTHLATMKRFWRSVLHNSGEYSGNPMRKHVAIPGIGEEHFAHWLTLFYETLREEEPSVAATQNVGGTARNIADSLLTGIAMRRDGLMGTRAGDKLPRV